MAEFIFKDMVRKQGLEKDFIISSAATSTDEIWNGKGNPVYPPAKRELARHGLSCSGKRAVQLKKSDYGKYDYFIGMDSANVRNMTRIFGGDPQNRISRLLDYTPLGGEVADPWYTGDFETAYRDIYAGCEGLLKHLIKTAQQKNEKALKKGFSLKGQD